VERVLAPAALKRELRRKFGDWRAHVLRDHRRIADTFWKVCQAAPNNRDHRLALQPGTRHWPAAFSI